MGTAISDRIPPETEQRSRVPWAPNLQRDRRRSEETRRWVAAYEACSRLYGHWPSEREWDQWSDRPCSYSTLVRRMGGVGHLRESVRRRGVDYSGHPVSSPAVRHLLGVPSDRLTPQARELVSLVRRGLPLTRAGAQLGLTQERVWQLAARAGALEDAPADSAPTTKPPTSAPAPYAPSPADLTQSARTTLAERAAKGFALCKPGLLAAVAEVSPLVVYDWMNTGQVPTQKVGRQRLVDVARLLGQLAESKPAVSP